MKVFGHPVHVMLVHFPVALWPAHWLFHVGAALLPAGCAAIAAFWLLVAGCALGWLAAFAGAADLIALSQAGDRARFNLGVLHGSINGTAVVAFSTLAAAEYSSYPHIVHGIGLLVAEAVVLGAMFLGNYFGGAIVWREPAAAAEIQQSTRNLGS